MPKLFNVDAEFHTTVATKMGTAYRIKVLIPELGIFINGMMVYPPNPKFPQWGVTAPSRLAGRGQYKEVVEFNKKLPLWEEIYDKCIEVAQLEYANSKDEVITDFDESEPINLDDIPF
jgi:hypothetical protein